MKERQIGKVISVDNFRVFIKLDDDLKSLYKSGYEDIYEVARINSYVVIPVGADKIIAIVTRVKAMEETELEKERETIFLTKAARYLVATMIGTIESANKYIQGVYNYPVLDNPVWYVTRADLDKIFDQNNKISTPDFKEDYYLPIGTSPAFTDYKIRINPDKFFGKHAAILGNTGSGKSCTVASIIQSLFKYHVNPELKNAHFIIFDTNGEYKKAFLPDQGEAQTFPTELLKVNTFHIHRDGLRLPYWFMNFDDFDYLFLPSVATQSPILKRSISISKNKKEAIVNKSIPKPFWSELQNIVSECESPDWKIKNRICDQLESFILEFEKLETSFDKTKTIVTLRTLLASKVYLKKNQKGYADGNLSNAMLTNVLNALAVEMNNYKSSIIAQISAEDKNIDLPIHFDFEKLINEDIKSAIDELEGSSAKFSEYVSTLKLRLESFLHDDRIATPLMFNDRIDFKQSLAKFLSFILGDLLKVSEQKESDIFSKFYYDSAAIDSTKTSQVTIVDLSFLAYEVLENVTGLIGRLILEFVSRFPDQDRGKMPIVLVLEEAQNYIPEKDRGDRVSISKRVFERIAREGRKYGVSILVSSQRPSELSKTVLSQCNSFIIHRLQNPDDQKYIRQLVSAANEDILQQLPILPQQHAIIMGDAVRTPVQVRINTANPKPNSDNPEFIKNWVEEKPLAFPDYHGITNAWEKGKKYAHLEKAEKEKE